MDHFHLLSVFVAVSEEQNFAAAARRLRMSPPAVSRAIAHLEKHLGVGLLTRTTRLVRLTEAGARYLADARRILDDVHEADEAAAGINASPRGHLAVTAPVMFGKLYVIPIITAYQRAFQDTMVSAMLVDRIVGLVDEGFDVGVRIGTLPDSSLRAIRVGQVRRVVCATPDYLKQHGTPKVPAELARHQIIDATAVSSGHEWAFSKGDNRATVRLSPRILVNTNDGALAAAKDGFGLTRLISYQIADELASGTLKTVLADYEDEALPVHVIHREGRHGSAKVRSFVDLAVARLRANPALH